MGILGFYNRNKRLLIPLLMIAVGLYLTLSIPLYISERVEWYTWEQLYYWLDAFSYVMGDFYLTVTCASCLGGLLIITGAILLSGRWGRDLKTLALRIYLLLPRLRRPHE